MALWGSLQITTKLQTIKYIQLNPRVGILGNS